MNASDSENKPPHGGAHSMATATEPHDHAVAASATGPQTRYEHYEILRREDSTVWELGRGAMGITYKAFDTRLHCVVALKVVHVGLLQTRTVLRERFLREARIAASVRHPNIASVFHLGETTDGHCFYAMEFIEGETLAELVRRRGPLPVALVLDIALQVAQALIAAGQADLIHRDLKPANIMLSSGSAFASRPGSSYRSAASSAACVPCGSDQADSGHTLVKVIDFGLARPIKNVEGYEPLTVAGDFVGTPLYASPEQLAGDDEPVDLRSDIFSLGCTLWFLLTAKNAVAGRSMEEIQHAKLRSPPLAHLREAGVPAPVVDLLRDMLTVDPAKRPQSPVIMAERIVRCQQEVLGASGMSSSTNAANATAPQRGGGGWWLGAASALGLLLVSAAALTAWSVHTGHLSFADGPPAPPIAAAPAKSVAVLPFDNLSDDRENAFLADGIQDDLLTSLTKISDLKVISRTSVMAYRDASARHNLREIARALNVANVLEGSVRRIGNRVRVTVQLIDARNDTYLWAETYDRTLSDALSLQGELAHEIANALRATLSPEENARVSLKPTGNPEAYVLFLQGREFQTRPDIQLANLQDAIGLYERAVALDPNFAVAYARLSQAQSRLAFNYQPSAENYTRARVAAERALALQPDLGEGHLAKGFCLYWGDHAYDDALTEFAKAASALPNEAEILRATGYVYRRQGRWIEAQASFQKAAVLGPRDPSALEGLARYYFSSRDWAKAARAYDQAVNVAPQSIDLRLTRALIDFHWKGDLARLRDTLAALPAETDPEGQPTFERYDLALLGGDYEGAVRILDNGKRATFPLGVGTPIHADFLRGLAALGRRDAKSARVCFELSRTHYEASVRDYPREPLRHVDLALVYAALGWRDAAIGEGTYATLLRPESADAVNGVTVSLRLAKVYAMLGDTDRALPLLEHILTIPAEEWNGFSINDLRRRPEWAALSGDARFQKLLNPK